VYRLVSTAWPNKKQAPEESHTSRTAFPARAVSIKLRVDKLDAGLAVGLPDASRGSSILFANAGIAEGAPLAEITEEHFDRHFDINVIVRIVGSPARDQATACLQVLALHGASLEAGAIVTVEPGRIRVRPPEGARSAPRTKADHAAVRSRL
jgi:hypothetical protein